MLSRDAWCPGLLVVFNSTVILSELSDRAAANVSFQVRKVFSNGFIRSNIDPQGDLGRDFFVEAKVPRLAVESRQG